MGAAGERKGRAEEIPSVAAYRDIYDRNAPRRRREDLPAHRLALRKLIFDGVKTPHAPTQRRVSEEHRWRDRATRQLSLGKKY